MKGVFGVAGLALSLAGCVERYNIRPTQLAELNERVTGEAADGFARDPVRVRPPTSFLPDISDQNRSARGADVPDLPRVQRNSPEFAGESGPVFSAVQRSTGTGDEMKTAGLIRTLLTERTTRADIASIEEPHARERESFIDEAADEALENGVEGSLLGNL